MPPKYGANWLWVPGVESAAEIDEGTVRAAYGLVHHPCTADKTKCRKVSNCRDNPVCFNRLGESTWLSGKRAAAAKKQLALDLCDRRRQPDCHVGLTNLGATCYVNSLLQTWYHNPLFRRAIFRWRPMSAGSASRTTDEKIMLELQRVFANMQLTNQSSYNPKSFVTALNLDPNYQQDAQEFNKLASALFERMLGEQPSAEVKGVVKQQFVGQYAYVTQCHGCQTRSERKSDFYELELRTQGNSDFDACMREYFTKESLDGTNQYDCSTCGQKQDATRQIEMRSLPECLTFQLMRYVYDTTTWTKKKLTDRVECPIELDMGWVLGLPEGTLIYDLQAILMHRGGSANSGHYIAQVKDLASGKWFQFDDQLSVPMDEKLLGLTEPAKGKENKKKAGQAAAAGHFKSSAAYMLSYRKRDTVTKAAEACKDAVDLIPADLKGEVDASNTCFLSELEKAADKNKLEVEAEEKLQRDVVRIYEALPGDVDHSEECEWLPAKWITLWLKQKRDSAEPLPIMDTLSLICEHQKLKPTQVGNAKLCSRKASQELFRIASEPAVRLNGAEALCMDCVKAEYQRFKCESKLKDAQIQTARLLKSVGRSPNPEGCVWMSKAALTIWKRAKTIPVDRVLNEEAACPHGNMDLDEAKRRLIPVEAWDLMVELHSKSIRLDSDATECTECVQQQVLAEGKLQKAKEATALEKEQLKTLLKKSTLTVNALLEDEGPEVLYAVPTSFLTAWRSWIRTPRHGRPESLGIETLLCAAHGGLEHDVAQLSTIDADKRPYELRGEAEYLAVKKLYPTEVDVRIQLRPSGLEVASSPEFCAACCDQRLAAVNQDRFEYRNVHLWIKRRQRKAQSRGDKPGSEGKELAQDPTFTLQTFDDGDTDTSSTIRRSARRQATKNSKRVSVSSTTTLRDLKIQLTEKLMVMPRDQHLFRLGQSVELGPDELTLGELKILPSSTLELTADEALDAFEEESHLEMGFAGTGLSTTPASTAAAVDSATATATAVAADVDKAGEGPQQAKPASPGAAASVEISMKSPDSDSSAAANPDADNTEAAAEKPETKKEPAPSVDVIDLDAPPSPKAGNGRRRRRRDPDNDVIVVEGPAGARTTRVRKQRRTETLHRGDTVTISDDEAPAAPEPPPAEASEGEGPDLDGSVLPSQQLLSQHRRASGEQDVHAQEAAGEMRNGHRGNGRPSSHTPQRKRKFESEGDEAELGRSPSQGKTLGCRRRLGGGHNKPYKPPRARPRLDETVS